MLSDCVSKRGLKIIKPVFEMHGLCYMDGLVSTGNKFPYTILKINSPNKKNF